MGLDVLGLDPFGLGGGVAFGLEDADADALGFAFIGQAAGALGSRPSRFCLTLDPTYGPFFQLTRGYWDAIVSASGLGKHFPQTFILSSIVNGMATWRKAPSLAKRSVEAGENLLFDIMPMYALTLASLKRVHSFNLGSSVNQTLFAALSWVVSA